AADVVPDVVCFAKKMQVGGILVSTRVDEVPDNVFVESSRINSTWGGSLVDMVRATRILEIIEEERLLDNVRERGRQMLAGLERLAGKYEKLVTNPRAAGVLGAIDFPSRHPRDA